MSERRPSRRAWLRACGIVGIGSVAGCLGDEDDDRRRRRRGNSGGDDDDDDDDDDEEKSRDDDDDRDDDSDESERNRDDESGTENGEDDTVEAAREDARIGVLMPLSGDLGTVGAPIADAATLPVMQVTEETELEVDVRVEDTETDPSVGVSQAQELVDAGYPAITGAAASHITIPAAESVFLPNDVVAITPSSTSPDITPMDGDSLLRTAPSDAWQGDAIAAVAREHLGAETVTSMFLDDDYGHGISEPFVEGIEDRGGDLLEAVGVLPEQHSYSADLETALADDPDVLLIVGFPPTGEQLLRDYYADFDTGVDIVVTDGLITDDLPRSVDAPLTNVTGVAPGARGPGQEAFTQLYQSEYGIKPGIFTAHAYDATAVLVLASLAADTLEGPAISEQIRDVANPGGTTITPETFADGAELAAAGESVQYQGASSRVEFDENGDVTSTTYDIYEVDAGGFFVTETLEYEP